MRIHRIGLSRAGNESSQSFQIVEPAFPGGMPALLVGIPYPANACELG